VAVLWVIRRCRLAALALLLVHLTGAAVSSAWAQAPTPPLVTSPEAPEEWRLPGTVGTSALLFVSAARTESGSSVVLLRTDRPVAFRTAALGDPPRVIVDLPGVSVAPAPGGVAWQWRPAAAQVAERVRVMPATPNGGARVIIDTPAVLPFRATRVGGSEPGVRLEVLWMPPHRGPVVIDPGHGGDEPGAIGSSGTREKEVNLAVALAAQQILMDWGVVCLVTRADDVPVDLWERAYLANEVGAVAFVSIHCNASRGTAMGTEVYYTSPVSARLASGALNELVAQVHRPDRGVHTARFVVTREAEMPAVLCELAFIDAPDEEALLCDDQFRYRAALGIARAVYRELKSSVAP